MILFVLVCATVILWIRRENLSHDGDMAAGTFLPNIDSQSGKTPSALTTDRNNEPVRISCRIERYYPRRTGSYFGEIYSLNDDDSWTDFVAVGVLQPDKEFTY